MPFGLKNVGMTYQLGMKMCLKPDRFNWTRKNRNPKLTNYKNQQLDLYTITGFNLVPSLKLGKESVGTEN